MVQWHDFVLSTLVRALLHCSISMECKAASGARHMTSYRMEEGRTASAGGE
jgi:hypothetical protein